MCIRDRLLVLWNMAAHTDRMAEAQIKHFTAFFPTEGNSLEYGNIMKAKIAEVTGAELSLIHIY